MLDLHNLYANAINFGEGVLELLERMPLRCVRMVHLSGGVAIAESNSGAQRLLDDHLHDPPPPVYVLLEEVAARVAQPLDVIIERDGRFPDFSVLLGQLGMVRSALARGRSRFVAGHTPVTHAGRLGGCRTSAIALEKFLVRVYTDARLRAAFLRS